MPAKDMAKYMREHRSRKRALAQKRLPLPPSLSVIEPEYVKATCLQRTASPSLFVRSEPSRAVTVPPVSFPSRGMLENRLPKGISCTICRDTGLSSFNTVCSYCPRGRPISGLNYVDRERIT